jgi:ribose transport system permease protein
MNSTKSPKSRVEIFENLFLRLVLKLKNVREGTVMISIIVSSTFLAIVSPHFLTEKNIFSTAIGLSSDGIITIGITLVLISGGIDFSPGSIMSLSSITTAVLFKAGLNIWLACVIGLIVGLLCGLLNGFFIGKVGLSPFITTIAVMGIVRGLAYVITEGSPISIFNAPASFFNIGQGRLFNIPIVVLLFVALTIIFDFVAKKSDLLRKIFYTGSNENAAILTGINTTKVKISVYLLAAFLASFAGIINMARFSVATPSIGLGADVSMRGISAAVIGGASLSGGEGTILGGVLGVILLNIINNGLILLNVPVYWQDFINGIILLTAVTFDFFSHKRKLNR